MVVSEGAVVALQGVTASAMSAAKSVILPGTAIASVAVVVNGGGGGRRRSYSRYAQSSPQSLTPSNHKLDYPCGNAKIHLGLKM